LHGAAVETYNDHRMAMSLALVGLKVPGVVIKNPGCVAKTYPGFWEDLDRFVRSAES
jgi:3-phosphoshikimate 1-carboxyvinyltransferase